MVFIRKLALQRLFSFAFFGYTMLYDSFLHLLIHFSVPQISSCYIPILLTIWICCLTSFSSTPLLCCNTLQSSEVCQYHLLIFFPTLQKHSLNTLLSSNSVSLFCTVPDYLSIIIPCLCKHNSNTLEQTCYYIEQLLSSGISILFSQNFLEI